MLKKSLLCISLLVSITSYSMEPDQDSKCLTCVSENGCWDDVVAGCFLSSCQCSDENPCSAVRVVTKTTQYGAGATCLAGGYQLMPISPYLGVAVMSIGCGTACCGECIACCNKGEEGPHAQEMK